MNSLLISHLDDAVLRDLEAIARDERVSVEELVRRYLRDLRRARMQKNSVFERNTLLQKLMGSWSDSDVKEFEKNIAPMSEIDAKLWQ